MFPCHRENSWTALPPGFPGPHFENHCSRAISTVACRCELVSIYPGASDLNVYICFLFFLLPGLLERDELEDPEFEVEVLPPEAETGADSGCGRHR